MPTTLTLQAADDLDADGPGAANTGLVVAAGSSLLTGLVASYKLDDTADSAGTRTLTNNNTTTFNTGKIGNAVYLASASNQFLSRTSDSGLQMSTSMTFACWAYFTDVSPDRHILAKDAAGGREYRLYLNSGAGVIKFSVLNGDTDQQVGSTPVISSDQWYCVVCWYDIDANQSGISINDGTAETSSSLTDPTVGTTDFTIGSRKYASFEQYMNGRIDNVNIWSRVLTSAERTEFYNSGAGKEYPFS